MKLADLDPQWWAPPGREKTGFTFICPHCRKYRIAIPLLRPLDGGAPQTMDVQTMCDEVKRAQAAGLKRPGWAWDIPANFLWSHSGDSFENLTLSPSVDASPAGCWHGWIQNGEARSC